MLHHTKDKGDLAVAAVIFDSLKKGYQVFSPTVSEHLPIDLILLDTNSWKTIRLQIKYVTKSNGKLVIDIASTYTNSKGIQTISIDKNSIDGFAIYNEIDHLVYYVPTSDVLDISRTFSLRIDATKNDQIKNIRFAKDYLEINKLFK